MHPRKKVSPWTKPHLLDWSPPNTGSSAAIFWSPRFTPPVQHSSKPTHHLHRGTLTAPYPLAPQHKKSHHVASQVPMKNLTGLGHTYPMPEQSRVNYYKGTKDIQDLHGSSQNHQPSPIRIPYLSHSQNSHHHTSKSQFGTNSLQLADYDNDGSNKQIPLAEDTENNRVMDVSSQHYHNNQNKPSQRKYLKLTENGDRQYDVTDSSLVVKRVLEKQEEVDDRGKKILSVSSQAPPHRHQFAHQWTDQ
ncbi:unnamed protein product [Meganyctiphanes norvegica]|uniref:Uncharacterized protein n=1 Tax=Meganyctiphanes norvegica TaxID=48144 RepID=A0AAV2QHJ8_MEGNR